ncbi:DUF3299 domain-containing protein [Vibrio mexicanus]|uniref:DUF3299 domain-containing protein n=1 Tax=Vibrio mexicanus TaxID=1004326 RepID=UPI00063C971E|nr:DUF3299 domain-containing protein [Vibrio mexicanus]
MARCIIFLLSVVLSSSALANKLTWSDLQPKLPAIEDPFLLLSDEQLFELGTLARLAQVETLSSEQLDTQKEINAKLSAEGLDVKWLFSKRQEIMDYRRNRATLPNQAISGGEFKIPGFIAPVEFDDERITKFFLVPTSGACVHTPPPPANQIVLVDFPEGMTITSLYQPIWVEGVLEVEKKVADVTYVDGAMDVETVYTMKAIEVTDYQL